ncbi:hypothetical protein KUCAC02_009153, partial [Chaenocephalus aceratus]
PMLLFPASCWNEAPVPLKSNNHSLSSGGLKGHSASGENPEQSRTSRLFPCRPAGGTKEQMQPLLAEPPREPTHLGPSRTMWTQPGSGFRFEKQKPSQSTSTLPTCERSVHLCRGNGGLGELSGTLRLDASICLLQLERLWIKLAQTGCFWQSTLMSLIPPALPHLPSHARSAETLRSIRRLLPTARTAQRT